VDELARQESRGEITFLYLADEPREEAFPGFGVCSAYQEQSWSRQTSAAPGDIGVCGYARQSGEHHRHLVQFLWSFRYRTRESERTHGDEMWIYNGTRPQGGAPLIDTPATDMRSTMWACFKHEIPVYFHWHAITAS
jgi:hypothetical protein